MTPRARDIQLLDLRGLERLLFQFCLLRAGCRIAYTWGQGKRQQHQMPEDGRLEGSFNACQTRSLEMKFKCVNVGVVREKPAAAVIFSLRSES